MTSGARLGIREQPEQLAASPVTGAICARERADPKVRLGERRVGPHNKRFVLGDVADGCGGCFIRMSERARHVVRGDESADPSSSTTTAACVSGSRIAADAAWVDSAGATVAPGAIASATVLIGRNT
jgi:hypothetical protein